MRVEYRAPHPQIAEPTLAVVRFGTGVGASVSAPLTVDVHLQPYTPGDLAEIWRANGPVTVGRSGRVRFAHDEHFLFAVLEEDERLHADIRAATESVYTEIREFMQGCAFAHLLRMWNFMDAVNDGPGDLERYRQFCVGRAHGLAEGTVERYPAATAIGRQQRTHSLQVFWLAGKHPGTAIENPRQVSAYRYPRAHGPVSPSFSRATVTSDGTLFISGTASIVGHMSQHPGDPQAQFEETLRNLRTLVAQARADQHWPHNVLFKVYVREPEHAPLIAQRMRDAFPNDRSIVLAADICRRELLLEIECVVPPER